MAEFGTLNWAVVIVYIIGNLLLGFILSKRVETADHFFLGRRTTPWWAIGISDRDCDHGHLVFALLLRERHGLDL